MFILRLISSQPGPVGLMPAMIMVAAAAGATPPTSSATNAPTVQDSGPSSSSRIRFHPHFRLPRLGVPVVGLADMDGDGTLDHVSAEDIGPHRMSVALNRGHGRFNRTAVFPIEGEPRSMDLADLDGDGDVDVVMVGWASHRTVEFGWNDGKGHLTFDGFILEDQPTDVRAVDMNDDDALDLVVLNFGSSDVSVLLGAGDGTFGPPLRSALPSPGSRMAIADLNGDGAPDFAASGAFLLTRLAVKLNDGTGQLGPTEIWLAGDDAGRLGTADVDNDGDLDVVLNTQPGLVTMVNDGDAVFTPEHGGGATGVGDLLLRDLDKDGRVDAVKIVGGSRTAVMLGNGDGTFGPPAWTMADDSIVSMAAGDVDGDGRIDLAVGGRFASVLFAVAPGQFQSARRLDAELRPQFVQSADMDHDGAPDLVVATSRPPRLSVQRNVGGLGFVRTGNQTIVRPGGLAVGDLDGDSVPDAVMDLINDDGITFAFGDGAGGFRPPAVLPAPMSVQSVRITDLDGNGRRAVVALGGNGGASILTWRSRAGRTLELGEPVPIPGDGPVRGIDVGDFSGDGHVDVVVPFLDEESIRLVLGDGEGGFAPVGTIPSGGRVQNVRLADVDGDGVLDVLAANGFPEFSWSWCRGDGKGGFAPPVVHPMPVEPRNVEVRDVNGDGRPDVLVLTSRWAVRIHFATPDGRFTPAFDGYPVGPESEAFVVDDLDGDGRLEIVTPARLLDELWVISLQPRATSCPADVDGNGTVDVDDLARIVAALGTSVEDPNFDAAADVDDDDRVDLDDVVVWAGCSTRL